MSGVLDTCLLLINLLASSFPAVAVIDYSNCLVQLASFTINEEHRLRAFTWAQGGSKNRMERNIYEEHRDLYSPDSILVIKSKIMECRNMARTEKRNTYRILVGKCVGKRRLGIPRCI
jgi:hypothetical protein